MTVYQAAIFKEDAPAAAEIRRAASTLGYPVAFERDGDLDAALTGTSGWMDVHLDDFRTGFEFFVESGESADLTQDVPIFAAHGSLVWTTAGKADDRQFLASLYLLRVALTARPGVYWDGAQFHETPAALEQLDRAINEARILLADPDHRFPSDGAGEPAAMTGENQGTHLSWRNLWTVLRLILLLALVLLFLRRIVG